MVFSVFYKFLPICKITYLDLPIADVFLIVRALWHLVEAIEAQFQRNHDGIYE